MHSFPKKDKREIVSIEKEFYRRLCDYGVETIKLLTISKEELQARMVLTGRDVEEEYLANGQSFFYFSSHQFNWEWVLVVASLLSSKEMNFVYQPQQSPFFNRLTLRIRTRFKAHAIARQHVSREVIGHRHKVRSISIVADQFPGHGNDKRCWINFLNQETAFFQTLGRLAVRLNYPVVFVKMRRIKRGYYVSHLVKLAEPPYHQISDIEIMKRYAAASEKLIVEDIPGWLWSHNRWKQHKEVPTDG